MLSQVETQILLADIAAVFCTCFMLIVAIAIIDLMFSHSTAWVKSGAYIVFIMVLICCLKPLSKGFVEMDLFFKAFLGKADVSDLMEPMRRLIKEFVR